MQAYIIRRLLLAIPTLLLVFTIIFFIVRVVPGDVARLMLAEQPEGFKTEETLRAIRARLGLDKPLWLQYVDYIGGAVRGDFGYSFWHEGPVLQELLRRLPVSVELGLLAISIGVIIAIPSGIISALRQDTGVDYISRLFAIVFLSVPGFWTATMLIVFPAIWWGYLPPLGYEYIWVDPIKNLKQMAFPALAIGPILAGSIARMTRSSMLEVLRQDYIRTAWAKGLRGRMIIFRHALKNALIPVITLIGLDIGLVVGGSVIAETVFALPGVGRLTINAIFERDYPQLQANVLFFGLVIILMNLVVDITYAWLDPRIRYH